MTLCYPWCTLPLASQIKQHTGGEETRDKLKTAHSADHLDSLWKNYFNNPSQWWDDRHTKTSPSSPDFRHKATEDSLWVDGCHNPCWVQEELRGKGLQPLLRLNEEEEEDDDDDGELYLGTKKAKGLHCDKKEEEKGNGLPVSDGNNPKLREAKGALVPFNQNKIQKDNGTLAFLEYSKSQEDNEGLFALVASLKACAKQKDLQRGTRIHHDIVSRGLLQKNVIVGSTLVNMYAKCGALTKAQDVFDEIPVRDVVLWNAIMAGYAQDGYVEKVLVCFERMQCEGLSPDAVTLLCILKACAISGAVEKGQELHARIFREGTLKEGTIVGTTLVDMYAKCGSLAKAHEVFDEIPARNVVSWNALITGYAQHGHGEEALICFERMQVEGVSPTAVTFYSILKSCGSIGASYMGQEIHAKIIREGLLDNDTVIGTALIDMYAKCGLLEKAQGVFDKLLVLDVVAWNALIAGYAQHEHGEKALNYFERMKFEGFFPDDTTLACILKACGSMRAADKGQEIHVEIAKEGLWEEGFVVGNALVDMYAKCSMLEEAQEVFDECPVRNVVTWNALITGYVQEGHSEGALNVYKRMQVEGPSPDSVTFIGILKGCGSLAAVCYGQEVHAEIAKDGFLEREMVVGSALVDMYASCGMPAEAQEVFNDLQVGNVVSWNALLEGYGQFGKDGISFNVYDKMIGGGVVPDLVTYAVMLNTCSHIGLLDKSKLCLEAMCTVYHLSPTLEHYACLVDLFCRAGHLDEAVVLIKEMPFCANLVVWHTMLSACGKCGNTTIGRLAFEYAEKMDEAGSAAYICLSNI